MRRTRFQRLDVVSPNPSTQGSEPFRISNKEWHTFKMNAESHSKKSPEERELEKKQRELEALQEQLAQAELDLATLDVELRDFERRYLGIVGVKYAELDEIEAIIAEQLAAQAPQDRSAHELAQEARTKAEESARTAGDPRSSEIQKRPPSPELKRVYREVAKAAHPDLADDEADRNRREDLMARANRAYKEGSLYELQEIFEEAAHSPESIKGKDPASRLVRVIRQISLVEKRLGNIREEIAALVRSDLHKLRETVLEANGESRDLLQEMASHLDEEIASARERLASLG